MPGETMLEVDKLKFENDKFILSLTDRYRLIDPMFDAIPQQQLPILKNLNTTKILYSLHGFLGTPQEMSYFDQSLIDNGYAIYHDIIPGFSATATVANSFQAQEWMQEVDKKVNFLLDNYEEVSFLGFSTGALILHHYLCSHYFKSKKFQKIKKIVLFSPFYSAYFAIPKSLGKLLAGLVKEIPIHILFKATHHPDMKIMLQRPANYLTRVPLKTARQIEKLGLSVKSEFYKDKLPIECLCFLSDGDRVADIKVSSAIVRRDFKNCEIRLFSKENVPHHLMVPLINPQFNQVKNILEKFFAPSGMVTPT